MSRAFELHEYIQYRTCNQFGFYAAMLLAAMLRVASVKAINLLGNAKLDSEVNAKHFEILDAGGEV